MMFGDVEWFCNDSLVMEVVRLIFIIKDDGYFRRFERLLFF